MIILCIFYMFFFLFAHKQHYAGRHFHGASQITGTALLIIGTVNIVAAYLFLIYAAIKFSVLYAVILFLSAFMFLNIINRIICKIVMNHEKKRCDIQDPSFWSFYNYQCDVVTTIIALWGIILNALIITGFTMIIIRG